MGYLIASEMSRSGHDVAVFGIAPKTIADLPAYRTTNLHEIGDADFVVLGGGGFLTDSGLIRGLLHSPTRRSNARISQLASTLHLYNKSLVPISIGGDNSPISALKERLLKRHSTKGTVRLDADLKTLRAAGVDGFHAFADILWLLPDYVPIVASADEGSRPRSKPVVGLNLKKKFWDSQLQKIIDGFRDRIEFTFVRSHIDVMKYDYECGAAGNLIDYTGAISDYLQQIADCDMIVSSKLHIGISAMSYGVPFLSYKGPGKARLALSEIGLDNHIIQTPIELETHLEFVCKDPRQYRMNPARVAQLKSNAYGHMETLRQILSNTRAPI